MIRAGAFRTSPQSEPARPRAFSSLRAAWRKAAEIDRRLNDCWIGDVLAGVCFVILSVGLFYGAAIAQAVWQ